MAVSDSNCIDKLEQKAIVYGDQIIGYLDSLKTNSTEGVKKQTGEFETLYKQMLKLGTVTFCCLEGICTDLEHAAKDPGNGTLENLNDKLRAYIEAVKNDDWWYFDFASGTKTAHTINVIN
jgi:hypothetical protein